MHLVLSWREKNQMTKAGHGALLDHLAVAEGGGADADETDKGKETNGGRKSSITYSSDTAATVSTDDEGRNSTTNTSSASSSPSTTLHDLPYLVTAAASSALLSPATGTSRLRHLCPALSLFAVVVILLIVGGIFMALYHSKLLGLTTWMQDRAPVSALYYGAFVVLWVVLCLPSTFVELCGGFIFGTSLPFSFVCCCPFLYSFIFVLTSFTCRTLISCLYVSELSHFLLTPSSLLPSLRFPRRVCNHWPSQTRWLLRRLPPRPMRRRRLPP